MSAILRCVLGVNDLNAFMAHETTVIIGRPIVQLNRCLVELNFGMTTAIVSFFCRCAHLGLHLGLPVGLRQPHHLRHHEQAVPAGVQDGAVLPATAPVLRQLHAV